MVVYAPAHLISAPAQPPATGAVVYTALLSLYALVEIVTQLFHPRLSIIYMHSYFPRFSLISSLSSGFVFHHSRLASSSGRRVFRPRISRRFEKAARTFVRRRSPEEQSHFRVFLQRTRSGRNPARRPTYATPLLGETTTHQSHLARVYQRTYW